VIASVCEAAGGRKGAMKVLEDSTKSESEPAIVEAASPKKEFGFEPDLYHHHQAVGFSDGDRTTTADEDLFYSILFIIKIIVVCMSLTLLEQSCHQNKFKHSIRAK